MSSGNSFRGQKKGPWSLGERGKDNAPGAMGWGKSSLYQGLLSGGLRGESQQNMHQLSWCALSWAPLVVSARRSLVSAAGLGQPGCHSWELLLWAWSWNTAEAQMSSCMGECWRGWPCKGLSFWPLLGNWGSAPWWPSAPAYCSYYRGMGETVKGNIINNSVIPLHSDKRFLDLECWAHNRYVNV